MAEHTTKFAPRTGGCYCGALRYAVSGRPLVKGQCHCRPCQQFAGGGPQYFELVAPDSFDWTHGTPASFALDDLENAVTRFFCATCGTQVLTRRQDQAALVLKVGTLDDPARFRPHVAICHGDAQAFHMVPDNIPVFDGLPPRG
ncbi:GFA family protein [uncultured Tateyamaria sp.]|uniref:GFA family protein n=1 Tax=uncultured Tateyamaria sp. TaxID=455651 RepID=UPI00261D1B11|nr:GFA family protein [uncultured Tateyamaria sp.]